MCADRAETPVHSLPDRGRAASLARTRFTARSLKFGTIVVAGVILALGIGICRLWVSGPGESSPRQFYDVKLASKSLIPDKRGGQDLHSSDRLVEVSMIQLI